MHTRISVSGLCFPTLDLAASLGALHDVGAGWTTLQARKFRETGWDRGIERVESSGIAVAGLVAEFPEDLGDPQTWTVSRAKMIEALDAAAALKAPTVYSVTGPGISEIRSRSVTAFARFIEPVTAHAKEVGVELSIETTLPSFAWVSFLHSLEDARQVSAMCDLGLCLDLFHVWDDPDLAEYLGEAADRIALVQIGDCVFDGTSPEKAVPGDGVVPLAEIIGQVARAGYNGVFDLELAGPRIDEEGNVAAARRGVAFLESALALE